jgi:putative hydrolase of the HAD superfamily
MKKLILVSLFFIMPFKSWATPLNNPSPKAVIFDFGGVMADFDLNKTLSFIAKELKMPLNEFKAAIKKEINPLAKGEIDEKIFWGYFAQKYNTIIPKNWDLKYKKLIKETVKPNQKMYNLALALRNKGYKVAMLSDVTKWQAEVFYELDLYQIFKPIALSYQIKAKKPYQESYLAILNKLKLSPQECIFIDDRIENVQHAKKLKINAIHFKSYEKLQKDLKQFLD